MGIDCIKSCKLYPHGYVGTDDMKYDAMDISSTGLVLGGQCKDALCGTADLPDPIIEFYSFSSQTFIWSKSMPTVTVSSFTYKYKTVQALSFNTAETKVAAVITEGNANGPLAFVLMDAATGASSIKMVAPTTSIYVSYPKSIVLDNSDNIFATLKHGPDFSAMMLSLTSGSSTKTTSWGYVNDPNIKVSQGFSVVADSTGFYTSA